MYFIFSSFFFVKKKGTEHLNNNLQECTRCHSSERMEGSAINFVTMNMFKKIEK